MKIDMLYIADWKAAYIAALQGGASSYDARSRADTFIDAIRQAERGY